MQECSKQNQPKIVVLGSCCVDFTVYAPRLPKPGETLLGTKFTTGFGGKGANQCVTAAKLGAKTYMICKLGDDQWGKQYKDHLESIGTDVSYVQIIPNVATGIAQISVAEKDGENHIIMVPGANNHLKISDVKNKTNFIESADVLIGQLETPYETTLEAFKINKGIKILNAAPARNDINEILTYCTILCVNETEASILSNSVLVVDLKTAAEALKMLLSTGCETVIITMGEKGAIYASKDNPKPVHVLCDVVTALDTTGAGDAFVGALATFLVMFKSSPMHKIIGAACAVATASVTKEGTQSSYPLITYNNFDRDYRYEELS